MSKRRFLGLALGASLSTMMLAACSQQQPSSDTAARLPSPAESAIPPAPQNTYTPPTADQLYQLVAPIALFPDKLVAQVLAGSTYPDEVAAANQWISQNPKLTGGLLQAAVAPQPWDPSIKGLAAFPSVLGQMAQNIQWTTALGQAYANDPADVMNAIQLMRERASKQGNLRTSVRQRVTARTIPDDSLEQRGASLASNADQARAYAGYSGPAVVPRPQRVIEIEPAQPDLVYVPTYDPGVVYGEVPVYPSYTIVHPTYGTSDVTAVGVVSFGVGIVVGALLDHHDGGWHSWGMNWGGGYAGGPQQPAVVYNNQPYVSRSATVVNRYTTNNITSINNSRTNINNGSVTNSRNTVNNTNYINNSRNQAIQEHEVSNNLDNRRFNVATAANPTASAAPVPAKPMSLPNFAHAGSPVSTTGNTWNAGSPGAATKTPAHVNATTSPLADNRAGSTQHGPAQVQPLERPMTAKALPTPAPSTHVVATDVRSAKTQAKGAANEAPSPPSAAHPQSRAAPWSPEEDSRQSSHASAHSQHEERIDAIEKEGAPSEHHSQTQDHSKSHRVDEAKHRPAQKKEDKKDH